MLDTRDGTVYRESQSGRFWTEEHPQTGEVASHRVRPNAKPANMFESVHGLALNKPCGWKDRRVVVEG